MVVPGFDDPSRRTLHQFFNNILDKNGTMIIFGDSVMKQFASAMTCEMERGKKNHLIVLEKYVDNICPLLF
jgi:hypothetical protein